MASHSPLYPCARHAAAAQFLSDWWMVALTLPCGLRPDIVMVGLTLFSFTEEGTNTQKCEGTCSRQGEPSSRGAPEGACSGGLSLGRASLTSARARQATLELRQPVSASLVFLGPQGPARGNPGMQQLPHLLPAQLLASSAWWTLMASAQLPGQSLPVGPPQHPPAPLLLEGQACSAASLRSQGSGRAL